MSTDIKTIVRMMSAGDAEREFIDTMVDDFENMHSGRASWEAERKETLLFIDATDTKTTTNSKLPFKNSTTINKISQLYNNIVTSYMEHIIPNSDWVQWVGNDSDAVKKEKRLAIEAYVKGKVEASNLEAVIEHLVSDYTDSGFCASHTRHVKEMTVTVEGQVIPHYTGTVTERINPQDVFWDVTATSLGNARKCIRQLYTMGSLKKEIEDTTNPLMTMEQFAQLREERRAVREALGDGYQGRRKYDSLGKQGFGTMINYINEGLVEVLRFFGDFYDEQNDELFKNHEIVIIDRKMIGRKESLDTWNNSQNLHISVYEFRKDSLAPIGPLSRVVGLQYKLDKRENFKEDLHDKFLIAPLVKTGDVREKGVRGGPSSEFEVEEGGSVQYLTPPTEVLRGDDQLQTTLFLMEELTHAPKESIGQRTPGEKTKFEVQLLDQGQNKVFRRKVKKLEREQVTAILNDILEQGRHHMDATDLVKTFNNELGTTKFLEVTQSDLNGNGTLVARGATIFAEKANALQTLNAVMGSPVASLLAPNVSRKALTAAIEELGDLEKYGLFTFGIGIQEDQELQRLLSKAQDQTQASNLTQEEVGGVTETNGDDVVQGPVNG